MRENEKMTVKEGMGKDYEEYVKKNQDGYGNVCIVAGALIGKSLDAGDDIKTAHDKMYDCDLTGFMAGCVAKAISHFHPRGDEFRKYWNGKYGITEEKANGGTVNPAIITVG